MISSIPSAWRSALGVVAALLPLALGACQEEAPTAADLSLLPAEPVTLLIQLPWADFGSDLEVYGGFGRTSDLLEAVMARSYSADSLNARTLMRFSAYPTSATVRDASGTLRQDTDIRFVGGYVVAFLDTIASTNTGPVRIAVGSIETAWHPASATWTSAVDTIGEQSLWPEVGAGPVVPMTEADWDPAQGDSVQLFLDSAQVARWADTDDPTSGARLDLLTEGHRLRVVGGALRLITLSTIDPDTVLTLSAPAQNATFVYDIDPAPLADGMRVGGAPSFRTVLDVRVPSTLDGPPELCDEVGCPFKLEPRHVSYAGLALRSRSPPPAFQPTDTIALDVRPVLSRSALPKSPLGGSLVADPLGERVPAAFFGPLEGSVVEIPITNYARAFLAGPDPAGRSPPSALGLLSAPEPNSFSLAEFYGPGGPNEPVLNLVVTVSPPMELQ